MRLHSYINEKMSRQDLKSLEIVLDRMFKSLNIDIEFTTHFFKRVNDARNKKDITFDEVQSLFNKTYKKYAHLLKRLPDNTEAVLNDLQTNLNVPFKLEVNKSNKMIDLISKTIMRKQGFRTRNKKYTL